jgi:para-nitrobenzyl esterase
VTIVDTTAGPLRGEEREDGSLVFRGIPFAAPPVGDLRFAPPQPVEAWSAVADATEFGPAAVQAGGKLNGREEAAPGSMFGGIFGAGELEVAEDCLYLNVWTPAADEKRRPVMVWIHGGAFRMGTGAGLGYDGSVLSAEGDVVVVTLNYRLGVLGFTYAPEIGSSNLGLLDQIAALEWVQREIDRFGGDPEQVTIFGESAGAKSVECLLAMPAARGLFTRAVMQSTYGIPMDTEMGAQRTKSLLAALGSDDVNDLRRVPLLDLLRADTEVTAAAMAGGSATAGGTGPIVDGTTLPQEPIAAFGDGVAAGVEVIIGTTLDEAHLFGAFTGGLDEVDDDGVVQKISTFSDRAAEAVEVYRAALDAFGQPTDNASVALAVQTDRMFRQHSIAVAEAIASSSADVYMYLFTWKGTAMGGKLGACHGIEIPFVFGTLSEGMGRIAGDTPEARALSDVVRASWLAFARTGRPDAAWPRYDASTRSTMLFGTDVAPVDDPLGDIRTFWAG